MSSLVRGVTAARNLVGRQLEAIGLGRGNDDRRRTGQLDQVGIAHPVGSGNDHLVARPADRHEGVVDRVLRPVGDHNLGGFGRQPVMLGVVRGHRLPELGNARRRRVMRLARPDRLERGFLNVRRRIKIGLAQREVEDLDPFGLQPPRLGTHRQRGRRLNQASNAQQVLTAWPIPLRLSARPSRVSNETRSTPERVPHSMSPRIMNLPPSRRLPKSLKRFAERCPRVVNYANRAIPHKRSCGVGSSWPDVVESMRRQKAMPAIEMLAVQSDRPPIGSGIRAARRLSLP